MLGVLNEHGRSMKKTNLASKAGLNYNVCLKYILMLNSLGWVEVNSEVSITDIGKGVFAKLLDVSEAIASTGRRCLARQPRREKISNILGPLHIIINTDETTITVTSLLTEKQTSSQSKQETGNNTRRRPL